MTKLKYTFITLITMLCALTLTSCMDLYDGDEVQTSFTVTFDANGGSGEMKPQIYAYGEEKALSANTFTKSKYVFSGWGLSKDQDPKNSTYIDNKTISVTSDLKLYALWESNICTITFDANGGTGSMEPQIFEKKVPAKLDECTFTRTGFIFIGWSDKKDESTAMYNTKDKYPFNTDTTLYAIWSDKKVTVTFDANGGTGEMDAQTFTIGIEQKLTKCTFTPPSEKVFAGWAESTESTEAAYLDEAAVSIESNKTLYAVWKSNKVTVTFDKNGGTGDMDAQPFTIGVSQKLTKCTFTPPAEMIFAGWAETTEATEAAYSDEASVKISDNKTLYAVWKSNKVTVKFYANGGTGTMADQIFTIGVEKKLTKCTFTPPAEMIFAGWAETTEATEAAYSDEASVKISDNKTLYAVWKSNKVTVKFYENGGTGTMADQIFTIGVEKKLTKCTFTPPAEKVFAGWAESTGTTEAAYLDEASVKISENKTLYAVWKSNKVTVKFYANGGTGTMSDQIFTIGVEQKLTKCTFTPPEGKVFAGWVESTETTEAAYSDEASVSISENKTLYAIWKSNKVAVTFDKNGGSGDMDPQPFTIGVAQKLTKCTFTKTGKKFLGWSEDKDATDFTYADEASVQFNEQTTLYAVWGGFDIYYSGGIAGENIHKPADKTGCEVGEEIVVSFDICSFYGYTFTGWSDGTNIYTETGVKTFSMPAKNVTLTAMWQENAIKGGGIYMEVNKIEDLKDLFVGDPSISGSIITFTMKAGYTYQWLVNGISKTFDSESSDVYTWDASSASPGETCITAITTDGTNTYSASVYVTITK